MIERKEGRKTETLARIENEADEKSFSEFLSCLGFLWCIEVGLEQSALLPLQIPFLLLRAAHISTLINSSSGAQGFGSSPALILEVTKTG